MREINAKSAHYSLKQGRDVLIVHKDTKIQYMLVTCGYNSTMVEALTDFDAKVSLPVEYLKFYELPKIKKDKQYIYLIEDLNYLKIGESTKPEERLKQIKTGNPSAKLLKKIEVKNSKQVETELHNKFQHLKYDLEWFKKDSAILDYFGATLYYENTVAKREPFLPSEVWEIIHNNSIETYKLEHGIRLNGVCDVWYNKKKITDLKNNRYIDVDTYAEMATKALEIINREIKKDPIKKLKSGRISYKEFLNNMKQ